MRIACRSRQGAGFAAAVALLVASAPLGAEPRGSEVTYFNQKYGFSLGVATDVFVPGKTSNPQAGALWESRDGQARLLAVAAPNASNESLQSYRQFLIQNVYKSATIDYAPVRSDWFVLSGTMDGLTFYERIRFACDGRYIYGWQLTYPATERQRYDRIVEAIHRSYRHGRGEDGRCGRS